MFEENINLLFNKIYDKEYETDYNLKKSNKNYKKCIDFTNQLSFLDFQEFLNENKDIILYEIKTIKKEYLYDSCIHGYNHNIKVLLFGIYLCKKLNLNMVDFRIILDACKYHDVGRVNDLYDPKHGILGAKLVDKIIDDPIYNNVENLKILKAIIEFHSIPDKYFNNIIKKYQIENIDRFKIVAFILKDADNLDRIRLSLNKKTISDLDPNYLRINESLKLVKCSHIINYIVKEKVI